VIELILPKYLVPVRPRAQVLEDHCLAVDTASGHIVDILPRDEGLKKYPNARQVQLDTHALLPGLINMHTHSPMTLLRGYADDLDLDTWLREFIWPAEVDWADGDFVQLGTELAVIEMLRGGTTCFNENYFFPDRMAAVAEHAGMRACIGIPVIGVGTAWADSPAEYLEKGMELVSRHSGSRRLRFALAPHSMYTLEEPILREIAVLSESLGLRVHMHLLEIEWEIRNEREKFGMAPLQHADELGLVSDRLIAVHMAHLADSDIAMLAEKGANVVHCPQSNLKLASGICRVNDLLVAGVNVTIGTDGAASNNDLDLLDELRTAALLAKGVSGDAGALGATTALELVTINAAKALGIDHIVGSIEAGKVADLCAIDLDAARTQPVHNVLSQLVYSAASSQITDVWVDGKRLLAQGVVSTLDEADVLRRVREWSTTVASTGALKAAAVI
jgi:5-methylthioadenosine/S-adenosylhomocysteine deaminase